MMNRWTIDDFDQLSWHDCHVHGLRLDKRIETNGTCDLELDIDFILEWIRDGDSAFLFRIAPATLKFHDVFGLRVLIDYATPGAGMVPFSIDGIERINLAAAPGEVRYRWRLPIGWPEGEITFEGTGFTQILRREPIISPHQYLMTIER